MCAFDHARATIGNAKAAAQSVLFLSCDAFFTLDVIERWNEENAIFAVHSIDNGKDGGAKKAPGGPLASPQASPGKDVALGDSATDIADYSNTNAFGFANLETCHDALAELEEKYDNMKLMMFDLIMQMKLQRGDVFLMKVIPKESYIYLGTPFHCRIFANNFPRVS